MNGGPIRVLHVITRLDRGGSAENTLLTVAGTDPGRYATTLAVGPTQGPRSRMEERARQRGVRFVQVRHLVRPIRPLRDLCALQALWRLMRQERFHIVHTHTSKAGLLGRMAAWLARTPIVVHTPHGHVFYGYYGTRLTRLFVWLERWAAHWTDRIVALTAQDAEEHIDFGIGPAEQFAVIHSGVDFGPFDMPGCGREQTRRLLGLDAQGVVIGTLGRLTAIKGQADLVRAFAIVYRQVSDAWLLLVGDGEERDDLASLAGDLGVLDRVVFAGWRDDIAAVLRAMDIFALPSLNEGMGKALVEAMYAGLPAVATAVGGVPKLIDGGRNGLLVPPQRPDLLGAALLELARDQGQRDRLGAVATASARSYSAARMVEKIIALYEELLREKGIETSGSQAD